MVANFVAEGDTLPFVVGHPKTEDPAYGWAAKVWREGKVLLTRGRDIAAAFADAVGERRFPNRSIKVVKGENGYRLAHIGFLGAAAPAVQGLKPISFSDANASEARVFTFAQEHTQMFTQADLDKAASDAAAKAKAEADTANKAKADEQAAQLKKLQFSQRLAECKAIVDGFAVRGQDVHITPAQVEGLAEFRAQLLEQPAEFTFAAADKTEKKATLVATFDGLLNSLPVQMKLGQENASGKDAPANAGAFTAEQLADKALEYQAAEATKGHVISIAQAVAHVRTQTAAK